MIRVSLCFVAVAPLLAAACGGAPPPAAATPAAEEAKPAAEEAKPSTSLPTECADKGAKLCVPPAAFVKRLCSDYYPDVALAMLAKGTPWARGYLRVKSAEAFYASGGVSSQDKLVFEEEFVVLTHREADKGGIQVSGAGGSYDVLRWDGSCASLQDEEVSLTGPSSPKYAKIPWKNLDDKVKNALLENTKINKIYTDRRKECKGATIGDVSAKCEKLDNQLSTVVVDYLRGGGTVPLPAKLP